MKNLSLRFVASHRALAACLFALGSVASGCDAALPDRRPGESAARPVPVAVPQPHAASIGAVAVKTPSKFAIEEAMGAKCGDFTVGDAPLHEPACRGVLPPHVASLLRAIPDDHPLLTAAVREEAAGKEQVFRAVKGYGHRPDFVARIWNYGLFWIRSFEGPDPATTVYMVYGPDCVDRYPLSSPQDCLPGAPGTIRDVRIYRVRGEGPVEDVTLELAPPPPRLTPAERRRYGIYLRPEGEALDTDIGLNTGGLASTPVMRWTIYPREEGDYEAPRIPASDPRGFHRAAHFGFLVWTGERFELRQKVSLVLWACGVEWSGEKECLTGFSTDGDPYLIDDSATKIDTGAEP